MKRRWAMAAIAAVLATAGCSGSEPARSADGAVTAIKAAISQVTKTVDLADDTDPNGLLGRSNGYDAATVIYDSRVECDSLGVKCGATLEQWSDHEAAKDRADYIQSLQSGSTMFGTEYDYIDGNLLLRVSGDLTNDQAQQYEHALAQHE